MTRTSSSVAQAAASLLAFVVLFSSMSGSASAQARPAPALAIQYIEHDPRGALTLGISTGGARDTTVQSLTVSVDDSPVALELAKRAAPREVALMVLIDTSGSMDGVPIRAAREAARALISRLPAGDQVGVISFAASPVILSSLSRDRAAVLATVDALGASGATDLYRAVMLGADQLGRTADAQRVIVLLSDGRDSGDPASAARAESLQRVRDSGAAVYAIGLGSDYDESYLASLASGGEGRFVAVHDEHDTAALNSVFAQLGGALGANVRYTIPLASLARGPHQVRARGLINGVPASASSTFQVTNAGLLRPSVVPPATAGGPIEVRLDPGVAPQGLTIEARVGGAKFASTAHSSSTIEIDPWRLAPGAHDVEVVALVGGAVAASEVVQIDVPALPPSIDVAQRDGMSIVRGRLQGVTSPTLVARVGGRTALSGSGELAFARPDAAVVVELLDPAGTAVLTQEISPDVLTDGPRWRWAAALAGGALILTIAGRRLRPRWRRPAAEQPPFLRRSAREAQPLLDPRPAPHSAAIPTAADRAQSRAFAFGMILVHGGAADGRQVALTRRPLTVGSAADCDIVLSGAEVRPQHARITVLPTGEVQVHGIAERGSRPYLGSDEDEWLVVHHGERIEIGSSSLQLVIATEAAVERAADDLLTPHAEAGR